MRYALILQRHICHVSVLLLGIVCGGLFTQDSAYAQSSVRHETPPLLLKVPEIVVPSFWGEEERVQKPDLIGSRVVRFLTDDEFPPMHFEGSDGQPTGFSVELARAACALLEMTCTVQVRRFDTLLEALAEKRGDVVAAAIPIRSTLYDRFIVTGPYHRTPARFVVRKSDDPAASKKSFPTPSALTGKRIAVVRGSAHEAFLTAFFPGAERIQVADLQAAEAALMADNVDYIFADGMSLALWLNGAAAHSCCEFTGGPYLESRFFGEGVGFIVRKEDAALRDALDYAMRELWKNGTYTEIYLRHFPVSFY